MTDNELLSEIRKQDALKARRDAVARLDYAWAEGFSKGLRDSLDKQGLPSELVDVVRLFHLMVGWPVPDRINSMPEHELRWLQESLAVRYRDTRDGTGVETRNTRQETDRPHTKVFTEAAGVLESIAQNPREYELYEARLKIRRDERARIQAAEECGETRGRVFGRIQLLQQLLGQPESTFEELRILSPDDLTSMERNLQRQIPARGQTDG